MDATFNDIAESYDVSLVDGSQYTMVSGRNLSIADYQNSQRYAIIDQSAASDLFKSPGLALHKSIQLDKQDYTIIGVYDSLSAVQEEAVGGNFGLFNLTISQIEIPSTTYERYNSQEANEWEITVYFEPDSNIKAINQQIFDFLDNRRLSL